MRRCDAMRVVAGMSFSAEEVAALDELLAAMRRGADVRLMGRSPIVAALARKVASAKTAIATTKARRAKLRGGSSSLPKASR